MYNPEAAMSDPTIKKSTELILADSVIEYSNDQKLTPEAFRHAEIDIDERLARVDKKIARLTDSTRDTEEALYKAREAMDLVQPEDEAVDKADSKEEIEQLLIEKENLLQTRSMVMEIKSFIPEDVLKRFDVGEIMRISKENFSEHLKDADLRSLIAYIEIGGIDLKRINGIPKEFVETVKEVKKKQPSVTIINLAFLSDSVAAELALDELILRIKGEGSKPKFTV